MISALTIAGSDPSGGAGIQQDLRVFQALGVAGLSAITAITVQNSQGVRSVHPVSADVLAAQIEAVMEDARHLRGIKIGMLGGEAQVFAVADILRRSRPTNVILDPVLASSGGVRLLDSAGQAAVLRELLPLCDLVTPNLQEAAELTGADPISDYAGIRKAGRHFLALGAHAVLIKGGHLPGAPTDYLFLPGSDKPQEFVGCRIDTEDTHGTGCLFSSAITGLRIQLGSLDWQYIIETAKDILEDGLRSPVSSGRGRGYPDAFAATRPRKSDFYSRYKRLRGLYVLTDPGLRPDRSAENIVRAALAGGAGIIQFRDKTLSTPKLIETAGVLKELCHEAGALFIVNDRVDVALACDADGVHLGPDDMDAMDASRLLIRDRKFVGVSVGTVAEAKRLAPFATYLAVGAIFGSSTKDDAGDAVGVDRIREIKAAFPDKPLVAIGGINLGNIDAVIAAGADAVAVISAVVCAPDMTAATRELCSHFPAVNPPVEEQ